MSDVQLPRENVYVCEDCGGYTVTVDVDEGTTPFMIQCLVNDDCAGWAHSSFYPKGPRPSHILTPEWEWYKPTGDTFARLSHEMKKHINLGGLDIRARTNKEPVYHRQS